jgi:hypothetical protein
MKKILCKLSLIVILASIPAFSAEPTINFNKIGGDTQKTITQITQGITDSPLLILPSELNNTDNMAAIENNGFLIKTKFRMLDEAGTWVSVPVKTTETGKLYITMPTMPNSPPEELNWGVMCPGTWNVRLNYEINVLRSGHNHMNPIFPVTGDFVENNIPGGEWRFWDFKVPDWSGDIKFTAAVSGACSSTESDTLRVQVPELFEIKAGPGYITDGDTEEHPATHFVTSDFKAQLQAIGATWKQTCPNSTKPYPLTFLQMSLPWGGLFDVNDNWKKPHKSHRLGTNADVSKWRVRKGNRIKLLKTMCQYVNVYSEGDEDYENPHYHLVQKNSKYPEDLPNLYDERFMDCCLFPGVPLGCINLQENGVDVPEHKEVPVETDCP